MLDMLCLTGQVGWARLTKPDTHTRVVRTTPVALFLREHAEAWTTLAGAERRRGHAGAERRGDAPSSRRLRRAARSFAHEIATACGLVVGARARRRSPNWSRRAWSRPTDSPACAG